MYRDVATVDPLPEVSSMQEKRHWPFGDDGPNGPREPHGREQQADRAHDAASASAQRRVRLDRLIVGGRGHARKRGLS